MWWEIGIILCVGVVVLVVIVIIIVKHMVLKKWVTMNIHNIKHDSMCCCCDTQNNIFAINLICFGGVCGVGEDSIILRREGRI